MLCYSLKNYNCKQNLSMWKQWLKWLSFKKIVSINRWVSVCLFNVNLSHTSSSLGKSKIQLLVTVVFRQLKQGRHVSYHPSSRHFTVCLTISVKCHVSAYSSLISFHGGKADLSDLSCKEHKQYLQWRTVCFCFWSLLSSCTELLQCTLSYHLTK